jgi:hypothetical protein
MFDVAGVLSRDHDVSDAPRGPHSDSPAHEVKSGREAIRHDRSSYFSARGPQTVLDLVLALAELGR